MKGKKLTFQNKPFPACKETLGSETQATTQPPSSCHTSRACPMHSEEQVLCSVMKTTVASLACDVKLFRKIKPISLILICLIMCMCLHEFMCATYMQTSSCKHLQRLGESPRAPGNGVQVVVSCHVGDEKQTWGLWESTKCFQPLTHHSI